MARKGLRDLNDMLFAQMDRLARGDMTPEQLDIEVRRTEAMVETADTITDIARISLGAAKLYAEHGQAVLEHLPQIGGGDPK